jgi:hypothetical protein
MELPGSHEPAGGISHFLDGRSVEEALGAFTAGC